jgi:hypothetical protein
MNTPAGVRILATVQPIRELPASLAMCKRCGIIREVRTTSPAKYCADCLYVLAYDPDSDHGTIGGYSRHRRDKTPICDECKAAKYVYDCERKGRIPRTEWAHEDAKAAHSAYVRGDRTEHICDGERAYQRVRQANRRAALRSA